MKEVFVSSRIDKCDGLLELSESPSGDFKPDYIVF